MRRGVPVGPQSRLHRWRSRWAWRRQLPHRERLERSGLLQSGRRQHRVADRRAGHGLRDAVHEQRGDEQPAVGRVHAGRRRVSRSRPGRPAGRSSNRPEAQRADPLLLAQQGPVRGPRAQRRGHQAGQGRHARRVRRWRHGQRGPERQQRSRRRLRYGRSRPRLDATRPATPPSNPILRSEGEINDAETCVCGLGPRADDGGRSGLRDEEARADGNGCGQCEGGHPENGARGDAGADPADRDADGRRGRQGRSGRTFGSRCTYGGRRRAAGGGRRGQRGQDRRWSA